jgi:hypothetical protein
MLPVNNRKETDYRKNVREMFAKNDLYLNMNESIVVPSALDLTQSMLDLAFTDNDLAGSSKMAILIAKEVEKHPRILLDVSLWDAFFFRKDIFLPSKLSLR